MANMLMGDVTVPTFDLGNILSQIEDIKGARQNRQIRENAMARQSQVEDARRAVLDGKVSALGDLVAISPDQAVQFLDALDRMDSNGRLQARQQADEVGKMAAYVLQGATPEEQAQRYAMVRENVDPKIAEMMPEQFDPNFIRYHLARAMEVDKMLDAFTDQEKEGRRHENALEEIEARGDNDRRTEKAKGEGAGLASADSNAIARAVGDAFGGFYDPVNGTFSGLDPDQAERALGVAARAEEIFKAEAGIGHRQAVKRALKEAKEDTGGGDGAADDDPLGLFK